VWIYKSKVVLQIKIRIRGSNTVWASWTRIRIRLRIWTSGSFLPVGGKTVREEPVLRTPEYI
jgi:hypothetical protein